MRYSHVIIDCVLCRLELIVEKYGLMDTASSHDKEPSVLGRAYNFDQQSIYLGLMQGDPTAWTEFYDYFRGRLDAYFERQNVYLERDRDELLQETMMVAFTELEHYDPTLKPLRNWVYGIAKNLMLRQQQRVYSSRYENELATNYDTLEDTLTTDGNLAEDAVAETDPRYDDLRSALSTLSASDQQILKLRSGRDDRYSTFEDIGQELGISSGTARMRYKRACDRLRKVMEVL